MKTIKFFSGIVLFLIFLAAGVRPASAAEEAYHFDAVVTCKGDDCSKGEAERLARDLAQAAILPEVKKPRPAWLTALLYGGSVTLGAAAGVGADVAGHQLSDAQVRPGEVILVGIAGGALSAVVTAILDAD